MSQLLFSETEQKQIVEAIKAAERNTSGEVRVHIEQFCQNNDVLVRAKEVFAELNMHRTDLKNGVLFYVATSDRKFAVLGDKGIDQHVPANFWNDVRDVLKQYFVKEQYAEGLSRGITLAGEQLKAFFPYQKDDQNELPDDISFG
jgi:uncharacterized membrane protein